MMSLSISQFKGLDASEILILSNSYNSNYIPIEVIKIEDYSLNFIQRIITRFNYPRYIDSFIAKKIGKEEFTLYMHSALPLSKIFMTHPQCKEFHFFDEGITYYLEHDSLESLSQYHIKEPWRISIFKDFKYVKEHIKILLRGYSGRLYDLPLWPYCYFNFKDIKYYSYSSNAFKGIPLHQKIVLDINNIKKYFTKLDHLPVISNNLVWIGQNFTGFYNMSLDTYVNAINDGFDSFLTKYSLAFKKIFF